MGEPRPPTPYAGDCVICGEHFAGESSGRPPTTCSRECRTVLGLVSRVERWAVVHPAHTERLELRLMEACGRMRLSRKLAAARDGEGR